MQIDLPQGLQLEIAAQPHMVAAPRSFRLCRASHRCPLPTQRGRSCSVLNLNEMVIFSDSTICFKGYF